MVIRAMLLAMLGMGLAACTSLEVAQKSGARPTAYPPDAFTHRVATSDVVLYWNCERPETNLLRLDGVAQNPWAAQPIRFLEFELVGVDGRDRTVSDVKGAARDIQIFTNQTSPFQLDLRLAGNEARLDLYYEYRFNLEEMDALLAGPPAGIPRLFAQTNRFLARDVCSETQHRVR